MLFNKRNSDCGYVDIKVLLESLLVKGIWYRGNSMLTMHCVYHVCREIDSGPADSHINSSNMF